MSTNGKKPKKSSKESFSKRELEQMLPWFVTPLRSLAPIIRRGGTRQPATEQAKVEDALRRSIASTSPEELKSGVRAFLVRLSSPSVRRRLVAEHRAELRSIERSVGRSVRFRSLRRLMQDAEATVPFAVFAYFPRLEPEGWLRRLVEPNELLKQASRERGEMRAKTLVKALHETAELVYAPFLRFLWYLAGVRARRLTLPPAFGNMVKQLGERVRDYPGLIEADAGWLRNSAAHARWEYLPQKRLLRMWDDHHPPRDISVPELRALVRSMFKAGAMEMTAAIERYRFEACFGSEGVFTSLLDRTPDLAGDDPERRRSAVAELDGDCRKKFAAINVLFAKDGWTKRSTSPSASGPPAGSTNPPETETTATGG